MDPMTLLVSAIGSLAACIAYLYKQLEKRANELQKKLDEATEFQRNDMTKMIAKYSAIVQDYHRVIATKSLPTKTEQDSDTLLQPNPKERK